ncbi:MAG: kynureninase [Hyphomicrobiales bacterium]
MTIAASRRDAEILDQNDPLASFRDLFHLPDGIIYLDGNSLGPMAKSVPGLVEDALERQWATDLITSWNTAGWWELPLTLGEKIAPLIGAGTGQTVVTDSTSINLYKTVQAALELSPGRKVIISESDSFPTDLYILEGVMGETGLSRRLIGEDGAGLDQHLSDDVAVVLLSNVNYRSGALMDMAEVARKVHDAGAIMVWDLCHSAGVIPMELDAWNVDFAVGCTYKYLNGGPGAPAFIYAAKRHHDAIRQPLSGWWGHGAPFEFETRFRPASGVRAFLCGTQPIISMTALSAALDVYGEVDIGEVRKKSMALTGLFIDLVEKFCPQLGVVSPRDANSRASQVALSHEHGYAIVQALIARGVIGDFRAPDILRFGFAPLFIRYADVWDAVGHLREIMDTGAWDNAEFKQRAAVT